VVRLECKGKWFKKCYHVLITHGYEERLVDLGKDDWLGKEN